MWIQLGLVLLGLLCSRLLFYRLPLLKKPAAPPPGVRLSVIIPARNEQEALPLLLADLKNSTLAPLEIICVDDASTDGTAQVIRSTPGTTLVSAAQRPAGWLGKAWACKQGAQAATGDLLLFLDADVRLAPHALAALITAYAAQPGVLSVQPYHTTYRWYEQLSMIFNLVQVAANGVATAFATRHAGLFGPVILMPRTTYDAIGGHAAAKNSIVDDIALGQALQQNGIPYRLLLGGQQISFRMYGAGLRALLQGWTKNYATGALQTPPVVLAMTFLWVSGCTSAVVYLIAALLPQSGVPLPLAAALYLLWVAELFRLTKPLGRFRFVALPAYPVPLAVFLVVFFVSLQKKLTHGTVQWKGRSIALGGAEKGDGHAAD